MFYVCKCQEYHAYFKLDPFPYPSLTRTFFDTQVYTYLARHHHYLILGLE